MTQNDAEKIGNAIGKINREMTLPPELTNLLKRVKEIAKTNGYETKPMGSQIKNTALRDSDYDLLLVYPTRGKSAKKVLSDIGTLYKSLSADVRNHSVEIKDKGIQIDIIPGEETKEIDKYKIPNGKIDDWIVRGQNQFIEDFNKINAQKKKKLSSAVKMIKLWKENHPNFQLPSLVIEKIVYDRLLEEKNTSHSKGLLLCMAELSERILKPIKHPENGPQINSLSDQDRIDCSNTLKKNIVKLKGKKIESWINIFGEEFKKWIE